MHKGEFYQGEPVRNRIVSRFQELFVKPWQKLLLYGAVACFLEMLRFTKVSPDFFWGLVFAFGVTYPGSRGLLFALVFGFLKDYYTSPATGVFMLAYVGVLFAAELPLFQAAPNKLFAVLPRYILALLFYALWQSFATAVVAWQLRLSAVFWLQLKDAVKPLLWQAPLNILAAGFWFLIFHFVLPFKDESFDLAVEREGGV